MLEQTKLAQGSKLKGGAQRRIAVTMDEDLFFLIRDKAAAEGRSISNLIVRQLSDAFPATPTPDRG